MLSEGFVESRLRLYLNPDEKYRTILYYVSKKESCISSSWNINQILDFVDCLIDGFFLNICTLDNTIELYFDCIKVYDLRGVLLHEYRED